MDGDWETVFCQLVDGVLFVGGEWDTDRGQPFPVRQAHQLRFEAKARPPPSPRRPFPAQQTYIKIRFARGAGLTLRSNSAESTSYWAAALRQASKPDSATAAVGLAAAPTAPLYRRMESPEPPSPLSTPSTPASSSPTSAASAAAETTQWSDCSTPAATVMETQWESSPMSGVEAAAATSGWSSVEPLGSESEAVLRSRSSDFRLCSRRSPPLYNIFLP